MPLLDHFGPPLGLVRPWEMVHSAWANAIATQLNTVLPAGYFAGAEVHWGREIEVDVATVEDHTASFAASEGGGTAVEAPPRPAIRAPLDVAEHDRVEVRVHREESGLELVAAVELVSPANKDRSVHRDAFAMKCAGYLHHGVSLVVADIVTERRANLHAEILERVRVVAETGIDFDLYAVAYRVDESEPVAILEAWPEELSIGADLPTLPLWITADVSVPVDLETSYVTACRSLRIDL